VVSRRALIEFAEKAEELWSERQRRDRRERGGRSYRQGNEVSPVRLEGG